jgi:hypothetical protein
MSGFGVNYPAISRLGAVVALLSFKYDGNLTVGMARPRGSERSPSIGGAFLTSLQNTFSFTPINYR